MSASSFSLLSQEPELITSACDDDLVKTRQEGEAELFKHSSRVSVNVRGEMLGAPNRGWISNRAETRQKKRVLLHKFVII